MLNLKIAKVFSQMAELYTMKDDRFRPRAYEKAARLIESMEDDLEDIYKKSGVKGLMEIEGIGKGMAEHIEEYVKTGKIKNFEKLKKDAPIDLDSFSSVGGVGPKMLLALYKNLGVKNISDLEKAARAGKVRRLPRFGQKTEKNILRSIALSREHRGRFLLGFVSPIVSKMEKDLASAPGVQKILACGSFRRRRETIGDIDILASARDSRAIMEYFVSLPNVEKIIARGETKSMVRLDIGIDADLRVVPEKSFGAALQYFTGSKDHNIELRKIAIKKGWKLNEYGLFDKNNRQIAGRTEEEIYKKMGLDWMSPEMRENRGEIELALAHKLPKIVEYEDVICDLQMHTTYSDGAQGVEEMAEAAKKLGRKYIAITDHVGHLKIAGAMDVKTIERQWREIDGLNRKIRNFRILKGCEADINPDGTIALEDKYLLKFDIVLGSIHSNFKMSRSEMTKRLIRAMENPRVDIISHPTGRVIHKRSGYELDMEEIFRAAARTKTILEINSYPDRLDLNDLNIRRAIEHGVKLSLGTDSHSKNQLHNLDLGIAQARRGWAKKGDIVNCLTADQIVAFLENRKRNVK
ncbi:MAG: PHP domain protein [Candidatus Moranbacteria bacterium GW2011_GWC1_45_18]|nr:MAG: PHP domain protein [Candidatus Moranbacteria bacterium GW2011_GWC2_40_12]KKT32817.1 MAG: PHP domain protein [Candidatus Moranbacteria bacterium GW2011_GWF2_44_10]KKT69590.1 MAG: PHP domain protein [Candidatus Moranbacteria bacterium GW2011_GWF1_44_4]KKT99852.1 MAG: PHP domain protein [Candidatus Moranbacteria bacterium GW2011_GWC1_45_18]OGI22642.1 MAG: DNA polymerase III [Candidatus Moranbacteria bacterium RIFOXYA1_FULL_44_8]OGI40807.1 MAG: DNA polymerase III [Candidatus Moranbacteria 